MRAPNEDIHVFQESVTGDWRLQTERVWKRENEIESEENEET